METSLALDHERTPDGKAHIVRALLKITGEAPATTEHVPLNLSIVLDRSGSMNGEPLAQAKEAAALLVRRLWPQDVVSVVAYDDEVETVAEPATGEAQADLVERIRSIETQGCTNLSGGWLRGRELVAGGRREGGANRVLLLTDGLANAGITGPDQLVGLCRTALDQGITTTTIGFGPGYDEVLLRRMAEAGGGSTYYIEDPDQAPAIFAEEIEGLLSLIAQNLTVDLHPASAARLILIHHRYPSHPTEDGVRIELGDLYARAPRMLLAEFLVPAGDPDAEVAIAELTVTAHVLTGNGGVERREIRLPIRASLSGGPKTDPEVRRELLLQEAARARDEARTAREEGDFDRASRRLGEVSANLRAYGPADAQLREEAEDLQQMAERFRTDQVTEADAKYLYQRSYAASTSRGGAVDAISRVSGKPGRKS
jgi:Ca-activated chloride channel family protein